MVSRITMWSKTQTFPCKSVPVPCTGRHGDARRPPASWLLSVSSQYGGQFCWLLLFPWKFNRKWKEPWRLVVPDLWFIETLQRVCEKIRINLKLQYLTFSEMSENMAWVVFQLTYSYSVILCFMNLGAWCLLGILLELLLYLQDLGLESSDGCLKLWLDGPFQLC